MSAPTPIAHRQHATSWWGMMMLIATEAALFAVLLFSALYLRYSSTPAWPPPGVEAPTLALPLVMTVLLLSSSVPAQLAVRASRDDRWSAARWWLAASGALALTFLVLQGVEYRDKLRDFHPDDHSYASMFFTITGLHGIHVVIAVALVAWCLATVRPGRPDVSRRTIENVVAYWHFVGVVWIGVFTTVYWAVAR